jgi:hypothetical protein
VRPRRTRSSNHVYQLPGGTEDNDLWCQRIEPGMIASVWVFDEAERKAIAEGANVRLVIYYEPIPPVSMSVTTEQPRTRR